MSDFSSWVSTRQSLFEVVLKRLLPQAEATPQRLHAAMRYSVLDGGKRVRPLLAYAAGELSNAPVERVEIAAAAVELIHAYSLVHDDMPCMDDDVLRRGKPTCHVEYDEATRTAGGRCAAKPGVPIVIRASPERRSSQTIADGETAGGGQRFARHGRAVRPSTWPAWASSSRCRSWNRCTSTKPAR